MNGPDLDRRAFLSRTIGVAVAAAGYSGLAPRSARADVPSNLPELTVTEAVRALRAGDLKAEEYVAALLARCHAHDDLKAFTTLDDALALEAARQADKTRAAGGPLGQLHGVPLALKDNIDTAALPTTAATPALRRHRPGADAPVAAALFREGAVLLGKTNMHELAFGITSNNTGFGAVRNPYDRTKIPGGSSGGTGAAIAARLAPAGLGSDTGGSVRIPAALCGISGLRPTVGRYSTRGMVPISSTRDTAGPMARSVSDLILLDSIITGESTIVRPARLDALRLGVPRAYFFETLDPALAAVIEDALGKLRAAGVALVESDIPDLAKLNDAISFPIALYETAQGLPRYLTESGSDVSLPDLVKAIASPDVKEIFETFIIGPKAIPAEAYQSAIDTGRPALQLAYRDYFRGRKVAAMIFPTTPLPARPIGQDAEVEIEGKKFPTFPTYIRNCDPGSNAGIPGLSLPAGLTKEGLPVGIELDGPAGSDRILLAIGLALEPVLGPIPPPRL
jgi:Asp-tRNA(Asn)/Glu-tRNA(Gln) amidotransferase A subunit family amidase